MTSNNQTQISMLQTLPFDMLQDRIGARVIELRKEKAEKIQEEKEEWLDNNAYDVSASKWMKQGADEFGTRCLWLSDGGDKTLYLEHDEDNNTFRYNYIVRKETQMLDTLYCICFEDGCQSVTEHNPPQIIMDDEDICIINMLELDDY